MSSRNSRHMAREVALQILYRYDVAASSGNVTIPSGTELARELRSHFEHFRVPDELREFAAELVAGSLREMSQLDQTLEKHASNWRVSRMAYVDRSLLRMALYEMIHFKDTPGTVVIDEAIELAKQFGTADTPAFINGVLDAVKREITPATPA